MLVAADVLAVRAFHQHAQWLYIRRMLPATVVGILTGVVMMGRLDDAAFAPIIGVIVLVLTVMQIVRMARPERFGAVPHSRAFAWTMGRGGGDDDDGQRGWPHLHSLRAVGVAAEVRAGGHRRLVFSHRQPGEAALQRRPRTDPRGHAVAQPGAPAGRVHGHRARPLADPACAAAPVRWALAGVCRRRRAATRGGREDPAGAIRERGGDGYEGIPADRCDVHGSVHCRHSRVSAGDAHGGSGPDSWRRPAEVDRSTYAVGRTRPARHVFEPHHYAVRAASERRRAGVLHERGSGRAGDARPAERWRRRAQQGNSRRRRARVQRFLVGTAARRSRRRERRSWWILPTGRCRR